MTNTEQGERYTVREDRQSPGMYVVHDNREDSDWELTSSRAAAQRMADRWNAQERALSDDVV